MPKRNIYPAKLTVNRREINQIIIDPHYKENHPYMSDELICELVKELDQRRFAPKDRKSPWTYFETDITSENKNYRLVFCLEDNKNYLGVIHCYRKSKYGKK